MALEQSFGCTLEERAGIPLLQWASWLRLGIPHGVTTRLGGVSRPPYAALNLSSATGDSAAAVRANRLRLAAALGDMRRPMVFPSQVHGGGVHAVTGLPEPGSEPPEADALVTDRTDVFLGVTVADCVPVLLLEPKRRAVGVAHAGWRGLAEDVLGHTVAAMAERFDGDPDHIEAAIGPHIGVCCYEVGDEVVERFAAIPRAVRTDDSGRRFLNLARVATHHLVEAGLRPDNINLSAACTSCFVDSYYSHRAESGVTGRFAAVIGLEEDSAG